MSGVSVVWHLLSHDSTVLEIAKRKDIMAGTVPQSNPLPAIGVGHIIGTARRTVSMLHSKMHTERVRATAYVKDQQSHPDGNDYPGLVALMKAILDACPNQRGMINGVDVDSILPDIEGPDIPIIDAGILTRSRDFIVKWVETA